ncbi:MAG: phosphate/phosphite/phosphonate ABC transporter substrate-binding protein [Gemmataceae bacterium]|nr:phosphate/phosphite/phosphonate ABC transporter substrate-binding protein [Gemmataceae bacterium]
MPRLLFAWVASAAVGLSVSTNLAVEKSRTPIRIGMTQSIFVDVPPIFVQLFAPSFNDLTKQCTGIDSEMVVGGDPFEVSRKLRADEIQFGVFQGVEFAWVTQRYDDLVPLMIAINRHRFIKAYLVTRKDRDAGDFIALKGLDIALPKKSKEHCRLFLDKCCAVCGQCEPREFFGTVTRPASTEGALDDVCAGRVAAAIVENVAWENYQSIKPGCAARLKIAKTSETFPVAAIAYRKGAVADEILAKFKAGMAAANKIERTRELMNLFQITAFEPIPHDYADMLAEIVKHYPAPAPVKLSMK